MEEKIKKHWLVGLGIYAALLLGVYTISNITPIGDWVKMVIWVLRPLIIGLVIAYISNPFFRFFERKLFSKINPFSLRRTLSLFFTYFVLFAIFAFLILLILPQLLDSILSFTKNAESYIDNTVREINMLILKLSQQFSPDEPIDFTQLPLLDAENIKKSLSNFIQTLNLDVETWLNFLTADALASILSTTKNVISIVTDFIFGLFISLYMLSSKEKRYAQIMRWRNAIFSDKTNETITKICSTADRSFGGFMKGKILDSSMVGVLVYLSISLLQVPYALLIAVIVAITDIVPVIGPFIGVIPSAVIILLTDPTKVIPFVICILVIQQIDGNILAPKILGENTGVSSLCVMIAITVMGALWGLIGMVLGVPLFATVLELTSDFLDIRLKAKGQSNPDADYHYDETSWENSAEPKEKRFRVIDKNKKKRLLREKMRVFATGGQGALTPFEHYQLESYDLVCKYNIVSKKTKELPEDFIKDEQLLAEETFDEFDHSEPPFLDDDMEGEFK